MSKHLIDLIDIRKSYGTEDALKRINLYIRDGEFLTLLGPSGCGKTTLLRLIAGFTMPTEGRVLIDGKDVSAIPPYKRRVNTVFQKYALFPHLNVYDNVAFGLKIQKLPKDEIDRRVNEMLELVNLKGYGKRWIEQLSGGQQQRVAIARALVNRPQVLLLDEPLGALDLKLRKGMQIELKRMQQHLGITFVFVTHDQEEALTMSDTVVVMNEGVIQQIGTPTDIYNEPKNVFVAKFIGESNILPGTMKRDLLVNFHSMDFTCVDKGFAPNEPVDVVIRPEDIDLVAPDAGMLRGIVKSVLFMGVHYEFRVECGDVMLTVHSTDYVEPGCEVGVVILPDAIHIMHKSDAPDAAEPLPQEDLPEDTPELLPEE
jgi:spermidine/putrescine transport system ATP-binding protein